MNERIRKLLEQATTIEVISGRGFDTTQYIDRFDEEKFAELIVFECVKAVMDGTKEGDHYAQRIEQHFDNSTGGVLHFGVEL